MDNLLEAIKRGLGDLSDGDLFEQCACELLRAEYPTLVPVEGGQDDGLDGAAIVDDKPIVLVATISGGSKTLANVDRNLNQMIKAGKKGWGVLVATSSKPSPPQCKSIIIRIKELGFYPAHPHLYTRGAIAQRLYHNPRIRLALLGITGEPPCLSGLPYQSRTHRDIPLIGRDKELHWLQNLESDGLVIGQPGMGKGFLLYKYAMEGRAAFLREGTDAQIADSIRE